MEQINIHRFSKTVMENIPEGDTRIFVNEETDLKLLFLVTDSYRANVEIYLDGEDSSVDVLGTMLANKEDTIDISLTVYHYGNNSKSNQLFKGIADDKARVFFKSKVVVGDRTKGNEAIQSNHNLLLSKQAVVDSCPELEIYADDVKCSHGVTTGQLNEDAIYYLTTRGFSKEEAINMLLEAFATEPFESETYKARIIKRLEDFNEKHSDSS